MSTANVVRYTAKSPEAAEENSRLIQQVFAELAADDPGSLRYAAFRLTDGVSFVHVSVHEGDSNPLNQSSAFAEFQREIRDRTIEPPAASGATLVGSYRFLTEPDAAAT
jgi:hypothetical protein